MKKALSLVLAGTLAFGALTGCSGGGQKKAEGEVKTLDVVWFSDGKEGESFKRLADQYTAEHPEIKIELIEVPYADLESKIKNMLNGKEAPALARLTNLGPFQNQLLDLGEHVSDKEAFVNSFGEGLRFVFDDKVLAAPMDVTANGLIYNKTAFEKAGVSVPRSEDEIWTWDEWKEAMKKVMADSDCKYGLVYDKSPQRFTTLLYEAGGSMLNKDLNEANFNTEETKRAVSFFKELHDEEIIPSSVWLGSENPNNLFRTGQVAMHFAGSWMIANYKEQITDFEWGVTYLPKEARRSSVPGGKYLAAFQNTGVEKEAAEFIEWISKAENNAVYCKENSYLSQVKGNESLDYEYGKEFFDIFSKELAATDSQPGAEWGYQAFTGAVQNDLRDKLIDVLAGKVTVDQYVEEMNSFMDETLKELK
ncbi:ABC transporter substrate-binding protein [Lacrimispora sp.]|uniref:ABC transporter substrate-binding protein n=1 Tax=Lacrimispora sp. TaxID=2719234 RepID=UPI00345F6179